MRDLSIYDEGQAYTETEYRSWLAEAGFSDICVQYGAAAGGASIVVAREKDQPDRAAFWMVQWRRRSAMVRVTVLYPNESAKRFDHDYYASKHLPMVMERLKGSGMLRYEVDKGLAGGGPGVPAPFVAACHLYFNAAADFQKGIAAHGTEIMGDIPNYTDISPQIQISEIVVG